MFKFTCPVCKHHDLEMVTKCTDLVESVCIDPETGEPKLKDELPSYEGLEVTYFRCAYCEYAVLLNNGRIVMTFDELKGRIKEDKDV